MNSDSGSADLFRDKELLRRPRRCYYSTALRIWALVESGPATTTITTPQPEFKPSVASPTTTLKNNLTHSPTRQSKWSIIALRSKNNCNVQKVSGVGRIAANPTCL